MAPMAADLPPIDNEDKIELEGIKAVIDHEKEDEKTFERIPNEQKEQFKRIAEMAQGCVDDEKLKAEIPSIHNTQTIQLDFTSIFNLSLKEEVKALPQAPKVQNQTVFKQSNWEEDMEASETQFF